MKHSKNLLWLILFFAAVCLGGCNSSGQTQPKELSQTVEVSGYDQEPYEVIHNNEPEFTGKEKKSTKSFENYAPLDSLGRCGVAFANICKELMPTEKRESIAKVKPSGWQTVKYDVVDGKYLYNRCHLIGYQLAGENANKKNLITGTRYLNMEGMLPFEDQVADYVRDTGNHVLYRVTPKYEGDNLVAEGVQMEGYSVEDQGEGICFNIFAYNVQPGITINYETGESKLAEDGESQNNAVADDKKGSESGKSQKMDDKIGSENGKAQKADNKKESENGKAQKVDNKKESENGESQKADNRGKEEVKSIKKEYVLNTNTKKFHAPSCSSVGETLPKNRKKVKEDRNKLIEEGYEACQRCNP